MFRSDRVPSCALTARLRLNTQVVNLMPRLDEHWRPFSLHCAVCSLPYNYIIKVSHLNVRADNTQSFLQTLETRHQVEESSSNPKLLYVRLYQHSCTQFENLWEEERGLFEEMGVADQVRKNNSNYAKKREKNSWEIRDQKN